MFKYQIELKEANSDEYTPLKSWARPFTDGTTLDETLDEGKINLSLTTRSTPIPPFSKIRITVFEEDSSGEYQKVGEINRIVGTSKGTKRTYAGLELWDWSIQTIEETKLLERYICRTMTSTNYLTKDYGNGRFEIEEPQFYLNDDRWQNKVIIQETRKVTPDLYGPIPSNDLPYSMRVPVYRLNSKQIGTTNEGWLNGRFGVITPKGENVNLGNYTLQLSDPVPVINYTLTEIGSYTFYIEYGFMGSYIWRVDTKIGVFENVTPRTDPTITSVCERLLSAGITRRENVDVQKFTLDEEFAAKYASVPAPEFSFTRQTLFEALLTVGGYIHAIPRLNGNVVTFDELGGDDEIDMTTFPKQVYCDKVRDINDFCATLDSPAQNLLNTIDREDGAITELGNDYITVRTEDVNLIIEANSAIIRTSLPINQIVKLECGFIPGRTAPVGDITAYVYESAEYDALSSYWDSAFPNSKGYALRYAQGDTKITGLQTRLEYPSKIVTSLASSAIVNIIQAKTTQKINETDIPSLAFRVTYVPIVTSRVTQRKPYGNSNGTNANASWDNTLVYNQGGNVVESSFYGDKMKGAIARLGNEVVQQTYDFIHYARLPKCGQKLNGMYIARVDAEYDLTRIRATLTLTKNFNMLAQYVGLNSNVRMYDISEKQSVETDVHYDENIYVGDKVDDPNNAEGKPRPIIADLKQMIEWTMYGTRNKPSIAVVKGYDKDGNYIDKPVIVPVVAFPFGNSIVFQFSMKDNYGAGFQNSGNYLNNEKKGVQRIVPYSDGLGEIETLGFSMHVLGWTPNEAAQEVNGYANLYPQYAENSITSDALLDTGFSRLVVKKDSREALSVVYQAHFVANRQSIVLGSAISGANAYVGNKQNKSLRLYFFKNKLNMLDKVIDTSESISDGSYAVSIVDFARHQCMMLTNIKNTTTETCQSWAIVEDDFEKPTEGGERQIFVGENIELLPGQYATDVYFTIKTNA